MKKSMLLLSLALLLVLLVGCDTQAQPQSQAVDGAVITVEAPWVRPATMEEGGMSGDSEGGDMMSTSVSAAYMVLKNGGPAEDTLVSATSDAAETVELHETKMDEGGMMQMQPVEGGIVVPANGSAELKPGGLHVMLIGLTRDLRVGDMVKLTLNFERAGAIEVEAEVREP